MNGITPEATADAIERCATLTPAERDVLIFSAKGLHSREVGAMIGRGHKAVEKVKTAIFEKLDVSSTVEAAVIAAKAGIV
jgi:DNA-binding NarL/FixJ family response regulator